MSGVEVSITEQIATVTLNRPDVLNSLSLAEIQQLLRTYQELAANEELKAILVTGAGRGFCAGWELSASGVPGLPDESLGVRQAHLMAEYFNPMIEAMHEMPCPVVAAVNGVCAGAGVSIALAADIVIATQSASFVLTFAPKLGLIPDLGVTWKLPRLIGWARAQAVTMLGERIGAEEAAAWGMIWRCVPDLQFTEIAAATASRLAAGPPGIYREVRKAYAAAQQNDLPTQMNYERLRQRELLDRPSFAEGVKAFREKRMPNFNV